MGNRVLKTAKGFSLTEVLIALAVISFGILGTLKLQVASSRALAEVSQAEVASLLIQDMAARLQSNQAEAKKGLSSRYQQDGSTACTSVNNNCLSLTDACPGPQLATHDLCEWQQQVARALPNGIGVVCMDSAPDPNPMVSPSTCTPPSSTSLPVTFVIKVGWTAANGGPQKALRALTP